MKKTKHVTVPIFVPHLGCPHDCIFCNQKSITGVSSFDVSEADRKIENILSTVDPEIEKPEIAFFGGSFTGIDRSLMMQLLDIGQKFIDSGRVSSMRCSTRPDYIDDEILSILKNYGMKTIELGVQSMSDTVLSASSRGHTAETTRTATDKIISNGFDFVGQMMIGLPFSTVNDEINCAKAISDMGAVGARIYPTAVFASTGLEKLMLAGQYKPLALSDAIKRTADAAEIFIDRSVRLLRIGLCETDSLHDSGGIIAGAFHPAIGEMCFSEIYLRRICKSLDSCGDLCGMTAVIYVPAGNISKAVGQNGSNRLFIEKKYQLKKVLFREDITLEDFEAKISII